MLLACRATLPKTLDQRWLDDEDEIPDEDQMAGLGAADMQEPLRLLLGAKPDVVIYGCTSATLRFIASLAHFARAFPNRKSQGFGSSSYALAWMWKLIIVTD